MAILHWSVIAALFATTVSLGEAQQLTKAAKVGYVATAGTASNDASFASLRDGLRDLGYTEGKTIVFDYRSAEGNQSVSLLLLNSYKRK